MSNDLRVALIGYGLGGRAFHAPLIAATPGLRPRHHRHIQSQAARRCGARFPDARVAESADWVWASAQRPRSRRRDDAQSLSRPAGPRFHRRRHRGRRGQARWRRRRRRRESSSPKRSGGGVPHHRVSQPPLGRRGADRAEARRRRRAQLTCIDSNLAWIAGDPARRRLSGVRGVRPEDAGGILYDLGPHLIDQARLLFGPIARVYAELGRLSPRRRQLKTTSSSRSTHESGVHSHLWASSLAAQSGPRVRILGSKAAYTKQHADVQEAGLRAGKCGQRARVRRGHRLRSGACSAPARRSARSEPKRELPALLRADDSRGCARAQPAAGGPGGCRLPCWNVIEATRRTIESGGRKSRPAVAG